MKIYMVGIIFKKIGQDIVHRLFLTRNKNSVSYFLARRACFFCITRRACMP